MCTEKNSGFFIKQLINNFCIDELFILKDANKLLNGKRFIKNRQCGKFGTSTRLKNPLTK